MSNTLLIGYDLNDPGQNYDALIERIKSVSTGTWWHHLDSTWIIKSDKTAMEALKSFADVRDTNDEILVVDITGDAAAWVGFNDKGSNWLKENL